VTRHAALVLLPIVAILGVAFPFLLRWVEDARPGRATGVLTAWNTGGAIVGALLTGFVLLPWLGLWTSLRLVALAYALTAFFAAARGPSRPGIAYALIAVVLVAGSLTFSRPPVIRLNAGESIVSLSEGAGGVVAVVAEGENHKLVFDNVFTLGSSHDTRWESMQAHVPLLLHPSPRRVFFLGLGTGITAGGALDHDVEVVEVSELVPEVITAARDHFGPWTNALFADERVKIVADDARHRLLHDERQWDVVIGDLFFPWQPGTAYLFSKEHLEAVRERLPPDGHFAQWLPCYQLGPDELEGVLRTFVDVFPQVTLWRGDFFVSRPILAVVGHKEALPLDPDAVVRNARGLRLGTGEAIAQHADVVPFHLYVGNLTASRALLAGARPVTDDLPWIQWTAPKSERGHRLADSLMAVGDRLLAFEEALARTTPPSEDPYLVRLSAQQKKSVKAGLALRRLAVHLAGYRTEEHKRARLDYIRLVPSRMRAPLDVWIE
jgi:spermidine synthase